MSFEFELSIEVSDQYPFKKEALEKLENNPWVKNQWPIVYFIQNETSKIAYVGESTNALNRIKNHLANPERCKLDKISIIGSDKFNKSATLDIESNLIQYLTAEGTYNLQNGNYGLINHNYYQQDLYKNLFKEVWSKLIDKKFITKSLSEIENSELFKYSPYKALNEDQYYSVMEILDGITRKQSNRIFVSGSAGTGKTILATYLIKLLSTETNFINHEELNDDELREISYIKEFRKKYPNPKIALVVAMSSLRETLKTVFTSIPGLKSSMIIGPSEVANSRDHFDLLIVDEAHRLRQYKNISWRGVFKKNNQKLGLDESGTELDWILMKSKNQIFFYDKAQSVKPSDVDDDRFNHLIQDKRTLNLELISQMRVRGGTNYIQFVNSLLNLHKEQIKPFKSSNYDLLFFDKITDLYNELFDKEKIYGLCRLVAGYSWEWLSDPKRKPQNTEAIDIEIENFKFQWNQTVYDWINHPKDSDNPLKEIGCIHTVQGYDLNYVGVIFGREINYNNLTGEMEIDSSLYFDKYGWIGAEGPELKNYIINIYKTLMYRGIKGTYVYAYHPELRDYLKRYIESYRTENPFRILPFEKVKPYINAIPLIDITAAAGSFSDLQAYSELQWIEPPFNVTAKKGYFVCKVVGESMNKIIPNGSYCLFKEDEGGSRNGKIVLIQSSNFKDSEFGSGFTVKQYHSTKVFSEDNYEHVSIILKPMSTFDTYSDIEFFKDDESDLKVVGIFEKVLITS